MNFSIRKMEIQDIPQIQRIAEKSWNYTYAGIIPLKIQEKFLKTAYSNEMLSKRIKEQYIYVSKVMDSVVGFANFTPLKDDGSSDLIAIYLYPEYQRKGIGTALLQEGIKNLVGVNKVYTDVEKENIIGTSFYRDKGFQIVKEFDDNFDGHILKTVRMVMNV